MSTGELSRAEAVALVQRIIEADHSSEDQVNDDDQVNEWLDSLDRALSCPSGHVSGLIFWPPERELSAEEVVDEALAYRPMAL